MKIKPHQLDTSSFDGRLGEYEGAIQKRLGWLAQGTADEQECGQQILEYSLWNGCILLALGRAEADALRYFRQAADYGVRSLAGEGSTRAPRAYEATVEMSEDGVRPVATHERKPSRRPQLLAVHQYERALNMAVCFGERSQAETAARYPEARYRNPEVYADEEYFAYLRAVKSWLLGDAGAARSEIDKAIALSPKGAQEQAFRCVMAADQQEFLKHMERRLQGHRTQFRKNPHWPHGILCANGLLLCKFALAQGMALDDMPYLPVHLLI
jgi:hypothetical protein